jgi:hypothetical protein
MPREVDRERRPRQRTVVRLFKDVLRLLSTSPQAIETSGRSACSRRIDSAFATTALAHDGRAPGLGLIHSDRG